MHNRQKLQYIEQQVCPK